MGTVIHRMKDDSPVPDRETPVHQGRAQISSTFKMDEDGNPTGGFTTGQGFDITWQDGVQHPTGAIIEDVLQAVLQRIQFFQESRFKSVYNEQAQSHILDAVKSLNNRTIERQARGVEGTYNV